MMTQLRVFLQHTYLLTLVGFLTCRPGSPHDDSCLTALTALSDKDFRQLSRISKRSFFALHNYIHDSPVFHSSSPNAHHKQQPASWHLAVALARLGENGNGASVGQLHRYFGIAVGSVVEYTKSILIALKAVRSQWLEWPSPVRRRVMAAEGVGLVDGTTLPLSQRPALDGSSYFDRKKKGEKHSVSFFKGETNFDTIYEYAFKQIFCGVAIGIVFKRMGIYRDPNNFFSAGEYLVADSAYPSLPTVLPAYKLPPADNEDNAEFNFYLAKSRVRNEHKIVTLGFTKRDARQLRSKAEMNVFIEWVLGCCTLHNMLAKLGDAWKQSLENTV
ncbi:hypothetical protein GQ600_17607 [Phytophthora cactorum]|nr:hypothetical protein GQ600_17607 [Phytophthora cactorum]